MTVKGFESGGAASVENSEGRRREEILITASRLFASSGLRTSLQEIAEACGILPGSLYHHFESKEAIVVELVRRYHAELDRIAADAARGGPETVADRISGLATAIALCAVRNGAAVQFAFYEPPAGAGEELTLLAGRAPTAVEGALLDALRAGRESGFVRQGPDLAVLADRVCQTMLHVGLGLFQRYTAVPRVAGLLCDVLLYGAAAVPPEDAELDVSPAFLAVGRVLAGWDAEADAEAGEDGRAALVRRVARAEFGRRGYEVTTIRDIASAAGLSTGTVYRTIGSKDELLTTIMRSFFEKVMAGWDAVFRSESSTVEKLDALSWLHINVVDRFAEEFKIQLAWLRRSPPDVPNPGWSYPAVLRPLKELLVEGVREGELRVDSPSAELSARCVLELTWVPEGIIRAGGRRAALVHARDTLLRGAAGRD